MKKAEPGDWKTKPMPPRRESFPLEMDLTAEELERLRRDVQKLRKVMICPGCGAKLTCFGAFCPVCGAELVKRHVCPNCGAALDPGANFCVNCGNRMAEPDSRGE